MSNEHEETFEQYFERTHNHFDWYNKLYLKEENLKQIKAIVEGGLKLMEASSQGFNKPYDGLDISLIHGRLLRIRELCK